MAGTKQFDTAVALEAAMKVFREKGYAGTSLSDLEQATGLSRTSLYNAWGNKEVLFRASLVLHQELLGAPLLAELEHPSVRRGLANMFRAQVLGLARQPKPVGCLLTNSCAAAGEFDEDVEALLRKYVAESERVVRARLVRAVRDGELGESTDVKSLARYFTSLSRTVPLMYRTTGSLAYVRQIVAVGLEVLGTTTSEGKEASH